MKAKTLQIVWHGKEPVFSVDFHPDGYLATGGADKEVKVRAGFRWRARARAGAGAAAFGRAAAAPSPKFTALPSNNPPKTTHPETKTN